MIVNCMRCGAPMALPEGVAEEALRQGFEALEHEGIACTEEDRQRAMNTLQGVCDNCTKVIGEAGAHEVLMRRRDQ